jgi:HD-GYP domain-containing protein (c-di-GMP phosphodiesterase class II)
VGEPSVLSIAEDIAACHHEWFDGRGYPRGLVGEQIPLSARITAVADVFDALTHRRPYKAPWPDDQAVAYIRDRSGTQFDPVVVEAFLVVHASPAWRAAIEALDA